MPKELSSLINISLNSRLLLTIFVKHVRQNRRRILELLAAFPQRFSWILDELVEISHSSLGVRFFYIPLQRFLNCVTPKIQSKWKQNHPNSAESANKSCRKKSPASSLVSVPTRARETSATSSRCLPPGLPEMLLSPMSSECESLPSTAGTTAGTRSLNGRIIKLIGTQTGSIDTVKTDICS